MDLRHTKLMVAIVWILATGAIGVMANVTSISGAVLVVGFGLVPPLLIMLRWNDPGQTLSESIQEARR